MNLSQPIKILIVLLFLSIVFIIDQMTNVVETNLIIAETKRIKHGFGKNPCDVIYQASHVDRLIDDEMQKVKLCQFSWVCEGKGEPNKNSPKYKQAERVAYQVLAYDEYKDVVPNTTLFFHNLHVDPLWPYKQVAKIGNHIFYSKAKKPTQKTTNKSENDI